MSNTNRSISFIMDGGKKNKPTLQVNVEELGDGTLQFSYAVIGNSELHGLFFDFNSDSEIAGLVVTGSQVSNQQVLDEGVTNLKDGNNMEGTHEEFDVGISFGLAGKGRDNTNSGTFVLSSGNDTTLTLDDIANVTFGARFSSNGYKLVTISPAAPDANDDAISTDEDNAADESTPNASLLNNDTDADDDQLTVVAVDGDSALIGTQFQLATGGLLTVHSDGGFDLDPNAMYEDLAIGETRTDSFSYRITDELLDPNNQGFDTATASITIHGRNDAPIISLGVDDSAAETVVETNGNLATVGTLTVHDVDLTDVIVASVASVATSGVDSDAATPGNGTLKAMLTLNPQSPGVLLDGTEDTDTLHWAFDSGNEAFDYLADDEELVLDYTVTALDDNGASDDQLVTITIDGSNDRPIAEHISASVGEDDAGVSRNFVAADVDTSDVLSYQILGQPVDSLGHQYGQVVNNNDGSFTFNPLDNFQFLDSGESRDMTFQYVAIDDSGTASDTSAPRTATIKVNGADDAPTHIDTELLFISNDQSMWGTGSALQINWREFYGVSWNKPVTYTLLNGHSKSYGYIKGVFDGIKVSTPSLKVEAGVSGRIGVSPYFKLNSGTVDSSIPVDLDLSYEVQYESGDRVSVNTGYSVLNGAYFDTESPTITFGLDLVLELAAYGRLKVGSSSLGGAKTINLFSPINVNVDESAPVSGYPSSGNGSNLNLIEFSSIAGLSSDVFTPPGGQNGEYVIPILNESSLTLSFPYIETTGNLVDPDTLISTGSDDVVVLALDLDEIVSNAVSAVPPMHISGSKRQDFKVDFPGWVNDLGVDDFSVKIYEARWDIELIDVDLIGTLTAVQDFTLDIDELPLILTLENGDIINGFNLGDTIEFDLPDDYDVNTQGDADGEMDYQLDIDMDALLNNWTTLDFDLQLWLRALKANFYFDTFLTSSVNKQLFGNAASGYFVYEQGFDLLNVSPLAELFGDEDPAVSQFDLIGFNTESYQSAFDIA